MRKQLLIAGGGIGGLAASLGASRAGWEVRLYERAAAFTEVGAGVQLGPNVVRRLQAWGLQRPLQDVAVFPERLQVRSALTGHELAALPLGATAIERYGAAYATIHRADLHGLLLAAVGKYTDTQFHLDHAIDRFTDAEGVVTVRTSRGKDVEGMPCWGRRPVEPHPYTAAGRAAPRVGPPGLPRPGAAARAAQGACAPATSLRGWGRACMWCSTPCAGASCRTWWSSCRAPRRTTWKTGTTRPTAPTWKRR
jgi:2-polyprenyl-6-methoxyphenol hydroxylase and related FAD-dependent oxidoreductases